MIHGALDLLILQDLPTVQDVGVILPEDTEIQPIGVISSIVEQLGMQILPFVISISTLGHELCVMPVTLM